MTVERKFVVGADTVELITDGEGITAHCLVCEGSPVIGRWEEYTLLANIITALYDHQDHVTATSQPNKETDVPE